MKLFKKSLVGIATIGAVSVPLATLISCKLPEKKDESIVYLTVNKSAPIYMVGDGGSLTDKSFNQGVLEGAKEYATSNGIPFGSTQPQAGKVSDGYIRSVRDGGSVVLGAGFKHGAIANKFFTSTNLGKHATFIGVDCDFTSENNNRLASIQFKTEQAGYLAGIYAVAYTNDAANATWTTAHKGANGKIQAAAYGGGKFWPVTSWMDGFVQGIAAANTALEANGTQVEMIYASGSSASATDFTNDEFASPSQQAQNLTTAYLNKGADIIFPVAGPQVMDTLKTINSTSGKSDTRVFGVDGDQFKALQGNNTINSSNIIGSALKDLNGAAKEALKAFYDSIGADNKVGQSFIDEFVKKAHFGKTGLVTTSNSTPTTTSSLQAMTGFKPGTIFDETQARAGAFAAVK